VRPITSGVVRSATIGQLSNNLKVIAQRVFERIPIAQYRKTLRVIEYRFRDSNMFQEIVA
jgi:hypothetical protein